MPASSSRPLNTWDLLKLAALLLMFVDHAGAFIFTGDEPQYWLRAIGRAAAPVFMFLAGFAASYRFSRELLLLAFVLTVSDTLLLGHVQTQNILVNILICRMIFHWFETHDRVIQRPQEWFVVALVFFWTGVLVQYGSFGFLFALSGYIKRHREHYRPALRLLFFPMSLFAYGLFEVYFSKPPLSPLVTLIALTAVAGTLHRFEIRPIHGPAWLTRPAKWASRYSAYIYVGHLIALEWATGIPL